MNGTESVRALGLALMLCLAASAGRAVVAGDASVDIQTNELLALQDITTVIEAEYAYYEDHGCFATDFAALAPPAGNYLSGNWLAARNGYLFSLSSSYYWSFWVSAEPAVLGVTGNRYFGADESGVIRFSPMGPASASDLPAPEGHLPMADAQSPVNQARDYLCAIHRAQEMFAMFAQECTPYLYAFTFSTLTSSTPPFLVGTDQEFGYTFELGAADATSCGGYQMTAAPDPILPDSVCFFLDQTGVIRERIGAAATVLDPPTAEPCLAHPSRVNRLRERQVKNEELARQDTTKVVYAQWAYCNAHGYFADSFTELLNAVPPVLTGDDWRGSKNGYVFSLDGGGGMHFSVVATATTQGSTGIRSFFADETGLIRVAPGAGATAASMPLAQGRLPESSAYDPLAQAKDALCSLMRAQDSFFAVNQQYSASPALLTGAAPPFLLGCIVGVIGGYAFIIGSISPSQYWVNMDPFCYTGSEPSFYADQSGLVTVRYDGGHATAADPPTTLDCMKHPSRANWMLEIPTPTVNQAAGQADPAPTPGSAMPVLFSVAFNVPVTGLDVNDVAWSGTATGISASVSGSGALYTLRVTAGSEGTLVPSIAAGRCAGATGIGNRASTGRDNSVTLITDCPMGTIAINGNRSVTDNPNATLALTWSGGAGTGVVKMRFSNDGTTWSAWEPVAATRAYTLPAGDGYKTVRVQYLDKLQNRSAVFSDYIRLDTAPPTGGILINNNAPTTSTRAVMLNLSWADAGSGVRRMRFSDNGATWTAWEPLKATRAHTLPAGPGYHTVRVQYYDAAQNYSAVYSDYIRLLAGP
jgi:hypothetical protein